jgi:hypothetical protein
VVGEQPYLRPGEGFRYTSGAILETVACAAVTRCWPMTAWLSMPSSRPSCSPSPAPCIEADALTLRYGYTLFAPVYDALVAPFTAGARRRGLAPRSGGWFRHIVLRKTGPGESVARGAD